MKNDPPEITALDTGTFTRIDAMASYSIINETTMILSLPFQNTNSKTKLSFFDYNLEIKGAYLSLNESLIRLVSLSLGLYEYCSSISVFR